METKEILSENEVTVENLASILKRAFFKTSIDDDGDLVILTDGPRVFARIDEDKNLLKFISIFGVKESAPLQLKHALVNKMNDEVVFARYSIPGERPDMLIVDYYMHYEEGIPAYQIVSSLRLFSKVAVAAINICDDNDLVE